MEKKLFSIFSVVFFVVIISCSNAFNTQESNKEYIISGSVKKNVSGAFPAEIADFFNTDFTRTANPPVPSIQDYVVEAFPWDSETDSYSTTASDTSRSGMLNEFILKITELGKYKIKATVVAGSKNYFTGEKEVELTAENFYITGLDIIASINPELLDPAFEDGLLYESGTGDVDLTFKIAESSGITKMNVTSVPAISGFSGNLPPSANSFSLTLSNVPVNVYILTLDFVNDNNDILYSCTETMNVFNGLSTDTWTVSSDCDNTPYFKENASYELEFYVSKEMVNNYISKNYYVGGTNASSSGKGTFNSPFDTVQKAVDKINSVNDGVSEYNIFLLGDIVDSATTSYGADSNHALVNIYSSKPLKLKISSYGTDATGNPNCYKIDAGRTYTGSVSGSMGRVISVGGDYSGGESDSVQLILDNIKITGGSYTGNGGGIIVDYNSKLILEKGAVIQANKVYGDSVLGGGIRLMKDTENPSYTAPELVINGAKIRENTSADSGGGISVSNGTLEINDGEICENQAASLGAGIHLENSSFVMNDGLVDSNSFKSNSIQYGAGIFAKEVDVEIYGGSITNNIMQATYSASGTGIYIFTKDNHSVLIDGKKESVIISRNKNTSVCSGSGDLGGAGLYIGNSEGIPLSNVKINNVVISENEWTTNGTTAYCGGGIHLRYASAEISNSIITGNKNFAYGTGVYVCKSTVIFKNTNITNNTFDYNGVVSTNIKGNGISCADHISESSYIEFYNGLISGNRTLCSAATNGTGVFVNGSFTMYDRAKVDENNDIYLSNNATVLVGNNLTASGTVGRITHSNPAEGTVILENPAGNETIVSNNYEKFVFDNEIYSLISTGKLTQILYVSSSGNDSNTGTIESPLKTLSGALSKITDSSPKLIRINAGETIQEKNPVSIENKTVTIETTSDWDGSDDERPTIIVDDSDFGFSRNSFITVGDEANVTAKNIIFDGNKNGREYAVRTNGGVFKVYSKLTLYNSKIVNGKAEGSGGGIYVDGILNMHGGTIVNNTNDYDADSSGRGGGIYVSENGSLNLYTGYYYIRNNENEYSMDKGVQHDNIKLDESGSKIINIFGTITGSIGIHSVADKVFTNGWGKYNTVDNTIFETDNSAVHELVIVGSGEGAELKFESEM